MMRVLIADDEPLELEQLEWMIHRFDPLWEVRRASDGEEALKSIADEAFDLVLLDINMPGIDGFALTQALRALPEYRATPILVLTTESSDEMKQKGRASGATGWLVKPFDPQKLIELVRKVIG